MNDIFLILIPILKRSDTILCRDTDLFTLFCKLKNLSVDEIRSTLVAFLLLLLITTMLVLISGCSGTIFSGIGSGQVVDFGLRVGSGSWKILSSGIG